MKNPISGFCLAFSRDFGLKMRNLLLHLPAFEIMQPVFPQDLMEAQPAQVTFLRANLLSTEPRQKQ
jgi:hypothetical protein